MSSASVLKGAFGHTRSLDLSAGQLIADILGICQQYESSSLGVSICVFSQSRAPTRSRLPSISLFPWELPQSVCSQHAKLTQSARNFALHTHTTNTTTLSADAHRQAQRDIGGYTPTWL
jgi:hypothetical protein